MYSVKSAVAVAIALLSSSSAALALVSGHTPPHLIKQGDTSKAVVVGTVLVQVLVPASGPATSARVIKSTNHKNDAAALDVAAHSTYGPAISNGKPHTEFFDFQIRFTAAGVSAAKAGSLESYESMLRANKFADAKAGLTTYLASNPTNAKAQLDLGLADVYLNDTDGAAAAFSKVDTFPDKYKSAAFKAFYEASVSDVGAKKNDEALMFAKRASAIDPNYQAYAQLGSVAMASGDYPSAIASYEKAKTLAPSAAPKERATIETNLVSAYLGAQDVDKAKAAAVAAKADDPNSNASAGFGSYFATQAKAKVAAGDAPGGAALYEEGALQDPGDAVTLYTDAAFAYLGMKEADSAKAKVDADKALAIDPADAGANFAAGVAIANLGKPTDALPYLQKADASAKAKGQTQLAAQIETNISKLTPAK